MRKEEDSDLALVQALQHGEDRNAFVWETDYFEANWQDYFWGDNYARLKRIKQKYDPDGLFFLHHGVGSEDRSADGFT